eukprot:CAMPEP_0202700182 /NCGR_PEP_ID=MMETSP1385-20130828/13383_1 /ASSEMBLY_ACC=CAM_ASM_000861 /TAXON_ID=933848 /ORGANISM="Elphidium margaritaceum" /LENGTH=834 /DNA_ID=CAMNT_0049357313 /DNA_START=28 /DNA_END=2532 /DNA_ORIENTATION=-
MADVNGSTQRITSNNDTDAVADQSGDDNDHQANAQTNTITTIPLQGDTNIPSPSPAMEMVASHSLSSPVTAETLKHHRADTMALVTNIIACGEQPKTDKSEIWAWYLYDAANSPFAGVMVALLVPLLLSDLAEQYGCSQTRYGCDIYAADIENGEVVQVPFIWELKATSYSAAMLGVASLFQAFVYLFIGPLADFAGYRTLLFRSTAISGALVCGCYVFFGSASLWQFVGWWTVIASILHGLSIIVYNSWLPLMVETHEDVIKAASDPNSDDATLMKVVEQTTDHFALVGFAVGYIGGMIVLVICMGILLLAPAGFVYDDTVAYGKAHGSDIERELSTFEELWARPISGARIAYSVSESSAHSLCYVNGVQFEYSGVSGGVYGALDDATLVSEFEEVLTFGDDGVHEVVVYTAVDTGHICGFRFYSMTDGTAATTSVGNASDVDGVVVAHSTKEDSMVFGGVSGSVAELRSVVSIAVSTVLSQFRILMVHVDGQFLDGRLTLYNRIGMLFNGIWYLVLTLVCIKYLKHRPGPALPEGANVWCFGIQHTFKMFRKASQYPSMFKYLIAWFLFSDGIGTLITCGVLFGRELLNMTDAQLAIMVLEVYVVGSIFTFVFLKIRKKYNISSRKMLLFHLIVFGFLPLWGLFGLIPGSGFGLMHIWELYLWVFVVSVNIGSVQSFARSVFSQLTPVGHESEFFSLFEITDKGSSWIGPLVVAAVSDVSNIRWSLLYIAFFFLIPLPVVYFLDMDKARKEAGRAPRDVAKRASLLFDSKEMKGFENELQNGTKLHDVDERTQYEDDTIELGAVIDKNLTMTNAVFSKEQSKENAHESEEVP